MKQDKLPSTVLPAHPTPTIRLAIPWLNTSLVTDIRLYFVLQPLLWLLGLELILPVLIAIWMFIKYCLLNLAFRMPRFFWWAILFGIWELLHIFTLPAGELDLFLKSQGTWIAIMCLFLVIYNVADTPHRWNRILGGIEIFCGIVVILGSLYIVGFLRFDYVSLLGRILPATITADSHFFSEISFRTFGKIDFFSAYRVRVTFWHPSSYASALLVIFGIQFFQFQRSTGLPRAIKLVLLGLTLLNLLYTFSRTTYISFVIMLFVIWWLQGHSSLSRWQKLVIVSVVVTIGIGYILAMLLFTGVVSFQVINDLIYDFRPYSVLSRVLVYERSWELVLQKPIWGWGTLLKLEGLPSEFSAGSHSDYLNVLFRFGIPGLLMYLAYIFAMGRALWKAYLAVPLGDGKRFLRICLALMAAMLVRQVTSELFWDLYVVSLLWAVWGLGLARAASSKFVLESGQVDASSAQ